MAVYCTGATIPVRAAAASLAAMQTGQALPQEAAQAAASLAAVQPGQTEPGQMEVGA